MNRHILGLSLVEFMVALAISAVLLAGVATVYTGNKRASTLNVGLARLQENLRLVSDFVAQDARMAGFVGCKATSITNALNTPTAPEFDITRPVRGFEGDSSTASFPTQITNGGNPPQQIANIGSDAFIILHATGREVRISNHDTVNATITTGNSPYGIIDQNDVVVISDCIHTAITQVTNAINAATTTLVHDRTAVASGPGNCWNGLAKLPDVPPLPACGDATNSYYPYSTDARVMKLGASLYYVATSVSGQTTSLFRLSMNQGVLNEREELIEGVESMQILYGEDMDADNIADRYVSATDVTNWSNISSIRIGFLIATPTATRSGKDTKDYTIAGSTISDTTDTSITMTTYSGGAIVHPQDKKLRLSYTTTIKLRNKGVM